MNIIYSCHDIAEILLKVVLNTNLDNQSIKAPQSYYHQQVVEAM
jgi:hypothetical protein